MIVTHVHTNTFGSIVKIAYYIIIIAAFMNEAHCKRVSVFVRVQMCARVCVHVHMLIGIVSA